MILENPAGPCRPNVEGLAAAAGVSAPTIVRFARAVGCDGLKDFKLKLAGALALGTPYLHRGVALGDSTGDVVRNVVGSLTSVLAEWQRRLDPAEVERAARRSQGPPGGLLGTGATSIPGAGPAGAAVPPGPGDQRVLGRAFQLVGAATMGPGDVLFAISFVGRMPALLEAVQLGQARGATVIALTRTRTPAGRARRVVLSTDVPRDATMRVGAEAYVVQLLIIEIVMVMVGLRRGPQVTAGG